MHRVPGRYAVSGASGLVGRALCAALEGRGEQVRRLVRRESRGAGEASWDPDKQTIAADRLEGLDGVVHLAGKNIADGRWTEAVKREIRESRVGGTALLARTLAGLQRRPGVWISASAVGFYGDRGDELLDEDSSAGTGFLAETCREWEEATAPAVEAGIRVVSLRIGVVLTPAGGALARMLPIFRLGLGGRIGDGKASMSWIGLEDLVRAILFSIDHESLTGPVNAVAPTPVTNAEFTRTLARGLGRPAILPVPAGLLGLVAGEMGRSLLLASTRVRPTRLIGAGFTYRGSTLEDSLRRQFRATMLPWRA